MFLANPVNLWLPGVFRASQTTTVVSLTGMTPECWPCRNSSLEATALKTTNDIPLPFSVDRKGDRPLIAQIAEGLRDAIVCGRYKPGDTLPSSRQLEARLGVSRIVVKAAFARLAAEGFTVPRPRVGTVVRDRSQRQWRGRIVTVVPPGVGNPIDNLLYVYLRDALTAAGYLVTQTTVLATEGGKCDDFSLLDTVLHQQTDLVVQIQGQDHIARWLSKTGLPFVRFGNTDCRPPNCVGLMLRNNGLAMPDFARHCLEAGVKSILQVADIAPLDATGLLAGSGVDIRTMRLPKAVRVGNGYDYATWARDAFRKALAAHGRSWLPELVFFSDDHLATGALPVLLEAGVRIPEDVRVVTWANCGYGPVFTKELTRMEMDNAAVGAKLADGVMEYLRTGIFPEGVVVGPRYIRGETF